MERTLEEIQADINITKTNLDLLYEEKNSKIAADITTDMKEGCYYRLFTGSDECIYFKYTKGNFSVHDGTGTIGYNGTSYVLIHRGVISENHRFSGTKGVFNEFTFDVALLKKEGICPTSLEEIPEEDYKKAVNVVASEALDLLENK